MSSTADRPHIETRRGSSSPALGAVLVCLLGLFGTISTRGQAPTAEVPATPDDASGLSEVELLLELRDAERTWDRLMEESLLPTSTRLKPAFDPEKTQALLEASQVLLAKMDTILASTRISFVRKDQLRFKKLSFLYDAVKINADAFKPSRDALINELYAQAQKEEGEEQRLAALLAGYKLREDFIDTDKSLDKIQAALDEFRAAYPKSGIILSLYFRRAENLEEIGDYKGAIEVLRKLQEIFPADPRLALLDSRVKRLEMIDQPAEVVGPTLDGAEFNTRRQRRKVILVDFWQAGASHASKASMILPDSIRSIATRDWSIVGVTLDDNREDVNEALERHPASWTNIFYEPKEGQGRGFESPLPAKFQVNYVPARFLISKRGNSSAPTTLGSMLSSGRSPRRSDSKPRFPTPPQRVTRHPRSTRPSKARTWNSNLGSPRHPPPTRLSKTPPNSRSTQSPTSRVSPDEGDWQKWATCDL